MKSKAIFYTITFYFVLIGNMVLGQWATSGNNIYNFNTGNVGIGNNSPSFLLHAGKNTTGPTIAVQNFGGTGGAQFEMIDNASGADWKFKATLSGGFKIRDHASGLDVMVIEPNSGVNALYIGPAGNVGIGTDSPDETLHISGKVKIEVLDSGNTLDKLVTWNPDDSTLRVIPTSILGGSIIPDPSLPVPIAFQGDTLWVHPTDNAASVDWTTAVATCTGLAAFGKDDWYAPNKFQLDAIYKQSYLLTGLEQYNEWKYWSSSEKDTDNAFSQRMDYGGPDPDPKTVSVGHRIRCVRNN